MPSAADDRYDTMCSDEIAEPRQIVAPHTLTCSPACARERDLWRPDPLPDPLLYMAPAKSKAVQVCKACQG